MNKNLGRIRKIENGKFLVWFADQVYYLKRLFEFQVGSTFEPKLPAIVAMSHEIRAASPKIRGIYGKLEGVCGCLETLDRVLYDVEKLAFAGQVDKDRKEACKCQLEGLAWKLADIWILEYSNLDEERQATLAG